MLYDKFYNREYKLTIRQKSRDIFTSSRLDIKFSIDRLHTTDVCESSISVLGLDRKRINSIAKIAREVFGGPQEMMIEVELCAGYNGICPIIYKGIVINAHVDSPPEMWLHLKCVNYIDIGQEPIPVSIDSKKSKMTYSDVANSLMSQIGMPPPDMSLYTGVRNDYVGDNFVLSGMFTKHSAFNALKNMNKGRWTVYFDMGKIFITDKIISRNAQKIKIDKSNGMISATNVDFVGCKVTTFLQDCSPAIQLVEVKSEFNIGANDIFGLLGRKFEGHYRGDKWQSTFELLVRDQIV